MQQHFVRKRPILTQPTLALLVTVALLCPPVIGCKHTAQNTPSSALLTASDSGKPSNNPLKPAGINKKRKTKSFAFKLAVGTALTFISSTYSVSTIPMKLIQTDDGFGEKVSVIDHVGKQVYIDFAKQKEAYPTDKDAAREYRNRLMLSGLEAWSNAPEDVQQQELAANSLPEVKTDTYQPGIQKNEVYISLDEAGYSLGNSDYNLFDEKKLLSLYENRNAPSMESQVRKIEPSPSDPSVITVYFKNSDPNKVLSSSWDYRIKMRTFQTSEQDPSRHYPVIFQKDSFEQKRVSFIDFTLILPVEKAQGEPQWSTDSDPDLTYLFKDSFARLQFQSKGQKRPVFLIQTPPDWPNEGLYDAGMFAGSITDNILLPLGFIQAIKLINHALLSLTLAISAQVTPDPSDTKKNSPEN